MYPHRIRLRGPWECAAPDDEAPRRIIAPCPRERLAAGPLHLVRPFGYPGTITAGEHVWLTLAGLTAPAEVTLNGRRLGTVADDAEYDVTALLGSRNRLELRLSAEAPPGPLWQEIALEIRRDAYLRDVVGGGRAGGAVVLTGLVVGTAPRPLELYALAGRHAVYYQIIEPVPEGAPFRAELTDVPDDCPALRVELVDAAMIWYAVELPIAPADERL